jgi:hypothetical protein
LQKVIKLNVRFTKPWCWNDSGRLRWYLKMNFFVEELSNQVCFVAGEIVEWEEVE